MAIPTITDISPATGPAGGRTVVIITGTNFALPPDPDPFTHWAQTVKVEFNGRESPQVKPYAATEVACIAPAYLGSPTDSVAVDVVVTNLDPATGDPVSGETVTETDGYTYTRAALATQQQLTWVVRHLMRHVRRQVMDNVVVGADPDWDPNKTTVYVELKELPGIVLTPRLVLYESGGSVYVDVDADEFHHVMGADLCDVEIDVRGLSHSKREVQNIANLLKEFVQRTGQLDLPETVGDDNSTLIQVPLLMTAEPIFMPPVRANVPIHEFTATIAIRHLRFGAESIAVVAEDFHGYVVDDFDFQLDFKQDA